MVTQDFTAQTKTLIDSLKGICATNGLGNTGDEYRIITQAFLYKFMNDKFGYEIKQVDPKLKQAEKWEQEIAKYSDKQYEALLLRMSPDSAKLKRQHFLSYLHQRQNQEEFAKFFDDTLRDIAITNNDIFSVKTETGAKVQLFDELSKTVADPSKRDDFCRAIVNQLVGFSFEKIFNQKFDFFATIFEYLIKDYNKDGGGKYAEYYTPHAVATIMASILVDKPVKNVTAYDPAAGSGSLLMSLAHAIGEDRCTIYSQDISQKSSQMLRLNLILNNLVHSIQNVIQGNTLLAPYHRIGNQLKTFDYVVSNPPFKLDFSDFRNALDTKQNHERFFAGIPKIPPKEKDKMAIYLVFIQHIMFSLASNGKAAIVVPTGFLTSKTGIEKRILQKLVESRMLRGVVSMPSNIFATTSTNVSVLFLDKTNTKGEIVLMDASKLGQKVKEGKNEKTLLSTEEENLIIKTFNNHEAIDGFSVIATYEQIKDKNYSLGAGQYFKAKNHHTKITGNEFKNTIKRYREELNNLFLLQTVVENIAKTIFDYWFLQFDFPNEKGKPYNSSGGKMIWNEILNRKIPAGWQVAKLGSELETVLGGTPDTKNSTYWKDGNIAWISSGEIDNLTIINANNFVTRKGLENSPAVLLPKGSIVVSLVRYIRVSILGINASTNQSIVGIRESKELKRNYLYPFLRSQVPMLMAKRTGAQQPHINKGEIDNIPLVIPSGSVLKKYYETTNPIYQALTNFKIDDPALYSLRDNLLPLLINGQIKIINSE